MPLPLGFQLASTACGLKTVSTTLDLGLVVSDRPTVAAGIYTQNRVSAAPVQLARQRTPSQSIRGLVVNSGNANACTGQQGYESAIRMTEVMASALDLPSESVLVMSTGIIGHQLEMGKIEAGIRAAAADLSDAESTIEPFARAMMTTDTRPKFTHRSVEVNNQQFRIVGFAKGAGMIAPDMATMLGIVMTDAPLPSESASRLLQESADQSFNAISVDGHTSTNDALVLLANGARHVSSWDDTCQAQFGTALNELCIELALKIVRDGEGATHCVAIHVEGAACDNDARAIARSVANSPLVKTAVAGCDPNWGRIISAAGYAAVPFDPDRSRLLLNGVRLFDRGEPTEFDAAAVSASLRQERDVEIRLIVGEGPGRALFWTCDLTAEYVRINADYST